MTQGNPRFESDNRTLAIAAMLTGMATLVINDALFKYVSDHLPTGQMIFIRGVFCVAFIAIFAAMVGHGRNIGQMSVFQNRAAVLRIAAEVIAAALFLSALVHMPISTITALMQSVPVVVTAGSAIILREAVGWRRWAAATVGFIGVLAIIQPGSAGFSAWAILALGAVVCVAVRDLATRRITADVSTLALTFWTAVFAGLFGLVLLPFEAWLTPSLWDLVFLGGAALALVIAYHAVIVAMRRAPIATVAPFRYSMVIWALIAGAVVWGERPNATSLFGIALVVGAGLYTFYRERKLHVS